MIRRIAALLLVCVAAACAAHRPPAVTAPKLSTFPKLEIPAGLTIPAELRQRQEDGWQRLQGGDLRGASRDFSDVLKGQPDFYPAEVGLGYVAMADRQFKQAAARFASALRKDGGYLPALQGQVEAELGAGNDPGAIAAIEQLLSVDPKRDEMRSRLDLVRMRAVQSQLEAAARARAAGKLDEAQRTLERAVEASPSSAVLARELARIELARDALDLAAEHARKAVQLDGGDAEALALFGDVLDAQGQSRDAADAYRKAAAIDPRPVWRAKGDALEARANLEALPPEYRTISTAASVTRAQVAAMIGMDLKGLIDWAPKRPADVITDVRGHWAAAWILPVTQAGVMDVLPNHTFQPNATVRRGDLAQVVSQLLNLVASQRPAEAAAWRAARPRFTDVPAAHASYRAIAAAATAGAMKPDEDGRFAPTRPASGHDLLAAVARLQQFAGR